MVGMFTETRRAVACVRATYGDAVGDQAENLLLNGGNIEDQNPNAIELAIRALRDYEYYEEADELEQALLELNPED
jgi:hypothetical protein